MSFQDINPPTKRLTRQSLKFALTSKEHTEDAISESVELRDRVFTNDVVSEVCLVKLYFSDIHLCISKGQERIQNHKLAVFVQVWRIFSSCLSFSDLKACRLVCTNFNKKVLSSPRFKNHVEMKISTDDLRLRKFGKSGANWKHLCVEIKPSQGKKDVERRWLDFALSDVTTLKLILPPGVMRYKSFHPPHQLWTSPKNLTKLTIDAQLLWDEKTFEKNGEVFSKLQELEIIRPCLYRQDEIGYISGREREMKALPALAPYLKNLTVLKIRTNMADSPDVDLWMPRSLVADMRSLLTIVHLNKNHLKELELDDSPLWSHTWEGEPEALMNSVFPELNSLQVRLISKEANSFIPFLKKQPLLQKLDLTVLGAIPADLFSSVKPRADLLSALRLKGCGFSNSSPSLCELLRSSKLKEFRLNSVKKGGVSANARREIIENLPPNIESIFLRASAEELRSNEIDPVIFERVNPLTITQLTLIRCHEIVTDRTVEFFCRNFKLLQLLNLSFADERCTDFGFTGIRPSGNRESFALSDLKGEEL